MEHSCFAVDFCRLPKGTSADRVFSCVTDLIWCRELASMLRFCGVPACEIDDGASQYQRFRAFCGVASCLKGHRLLDFIRQLIKNVFQIDLPLCADTCDEIWKISSQKMMEANITAGEIFKRYQLPSTTGILCGPEEGEDALAIGGAPVLDGNALLDTCASDWTSWEKELLAICDRMDRLKCDRVYLCLNSSFRYQRVSPYHVDQALKSKTEKEGTWVKAAQLLRFFSIECQRRNWSLLLRVDCPSAEVISAWEQMAHSVGLPSVVWSAADPASVKELLGASAELGQGEMRWALSLSDLPSGGELSRALEFYAARYPIGRLLVFSDTSLPYLPFEQARFMQALREFYK